MSQPQPYGQQPPYGYQPQPPYGYAPIGVPASGKATASLVLGLLGIFTCGLSSIPGVILGHLALSETRDGRKTGRGQAVWGTILSWLILTPWVIGLVLALIGVVSTPFLPSPSSTPTLTP